MIDKGYRKGVREKSLQLLFLLQDGLLSGEELELIKDVMFKVVCFYPVLLGMIQFVTWSRFTIRRSILSYEYRVPTTPI